MKLKGILVFFLLVLSTHSFSQMEKRTISDETTLRPPYAGTEVFRVSRNSLYYKVSFNDIFRWIDSLIASSSSGISTSDTAAMLSPYLRIADTLHMTYNFPLVRAGNTLSIDTGSTGLATQYDLSISSAAGILASDTASMLANYLIYGDTASMLANYLHEGDTVSLSFSSPLIRSGNIISIQNAAADGSTKGASSFDTDDFNSSTGNISIDYVNGQRADGSDPGFLGPTDFISFNSRVPGVRTITVAPPLTGGGDLTTDRTIAADTGAAGRAKTKLATIYYVDSIANASTSGATLTPGYGISGSAYDGTVNRSWIVDTSAIATPYDISLKVNVSDTATMLSHYIDRADTAAMLNNYLRDGEDRGDTAFNGNRSVTLANASPFTNTNFGGSTVTAFLGNVFFPSQVPTTSLTGGTTLEKRSAGSTNVLFRWTACRQASTQPISTINVASNSKTGFAQPSAGGCVIWTGGNPWGDTTIAITNNTNTTYGVTVTTTDSKTASTSQTVSWSWKRYWGICVDSIPTQLEILAATNGGNQLNESSANSNFTITTSSSTRMFYAYVSSAGTLSNIIIGGLQQIGNFYTNTLSITNALGGNTTYRYYALKQPTASSVTIQSAN